jgi:nucleoside-diphosphate-sugar epimerase
LRDCRSILVLGASGMLGNAVFRQLTGMQGMNVWGSLRSGGALRHFPKEAAGRLVTGVDVENLDQLARLLSQTSPDVIINCVGLVKQLADANDPLAALPINSLLPHRLARLASLTGARVVHISTDCVFSGQRGGYTDHRRHRLVRQRRTSTGSSTRELRRDPDLQPRREEAGGHAHRATTTRQVLHRRRARYAKRARSHARRGLCVPCRGTEAGAVVRVLSRWRRCDERAGHRERDARCYRRGRAALRMC